MPKTLLLFAVAFCALVFCSVDLDAQKKDRKGKEDNDALPQDYVQIQNVKELTGKVSAADGKSIGFLLEVSHMEPNPAFKGYKAPTGALVAAQRRYEEIMRDYAAIARAKNPAARARLYAELQRDIAAFQLQMAKAAGVGAKPPKDGPFKIVTNTKEFSLDLADKAVVRWNNPPFMYDDKGNPKTYTKEELAKLRGKDAKLPGYEGKFEDLAAGQTVKIFLTPPPKAAAKDKDKKDDLEGVGNVPRPAINMVLILEDGPALSFGTDKKKKK